MTTIAITGEMTPQMIRILKDQINKLNPTLYVETIKGLNIPTNETLNDLKNAKSLETQYESHDDLINELMLEIKAEQ